MTSTDVRPPLEPSQHDLMAELYERWTSVPVEERRIDVILTGSGPLLGDRHINQGDLKTLADYGYIRLGSGRGTFDVEVTNDGLAYIRGASDSVPRLLLEPITIAEYDKLEPLIGELNNAVQAAIADGSLDERQVAQLEAIVEMAHSIHRDIEPEKTPRYEFDGWFRSTVRYLMSGFPRDVAAWTLLYEKVRHIWE